MSSGLSCPAWKVWANPIFHRYRRSRLRPQALFVSLLVTMLFSGFLFFIIRTASMYRGNMLPSDAERTPLLPLLALQGLILFFMGVGQAVGGIISEVDEGVIDYQRLQPMSPLAKVAGFWLGLPVREWVMFASTLPFTAWGLWQGQVPFRAWASVYAVLISSALMYHVTAMTAGMVIKNRRAATLSSMFVMVMLYTVLPQIAKAGLIFFDYLTLWPVLNENVHHFLPRDAGSVAKAINALNPQVKFYGLAFDSIVFTFICQGGLMLTFATMLWRRWRSAESHLLGKAWAVGLFAWMQALLLGNALPLIEPGSIFPTRSFQARFAGQPVDPSLAEGMAMIGLFGIITMLLLLGLTFIITPSLDTQWRGLRRAKKLALPQVPRFSDAGSSLPFVMVMTLMGAAAWTIFAHALMSSRWFPGHELPAHSPLVFLLVLMNATMAFQAVLEGWGGKRLFLAIIFAGIVPILAGFIVGMAGDRLLTLAVWLNASSPAYGPVAASTVLVPDVSLPLAVSRSVPLSFWFFQSVLLMLTLWLLARLRRMHRQRRSALDQA